MGVYVHTCMAVFKMVQLCAVAYSLKSRLFCPRSIQCMFLFLDHRPFSAPFSNALDLWRCSCYVRTYLKVEVLNMCPSQCTHLVIHNVRCVLIRCPHQNISVSYPSAITSQVQSVKVVLECHVTVLINRTRSWRGLVLTKWSNCRVACEGEIMSSHRDWLWLIPHTTYSTTGLHTVYIILYHYTYTYTNVYLSDAFPWLVWLWNILGWVASQAMAVMTTEDPYRVDTESIRYYSPH